MTLAVLAAKGVCLRGGIVLGRVVGMLQLDVFVRLIDVP